MISLYDRVRVLSGADAGRTGTVVEIDRRFSGAEMRVVYCVRFTHAERSEEFEEPALEPTGESALPFRFGEVVRIVGADAPDERSYIGWTAVIHGATEADDGTFAFALLPDGADEIHTFHQRDLAPTGRFEEGT